VAFVFDFDPTNRVLRSTFTARVSDEDFVNHQRVGLLLVTSLDPRFAMIDLSAADPFDVTTGGMRALAKLPPAMPKVERPRVIVAPTDHTFAMARVFEAEGWATRPNLHVVRSVREAWAIFGIEMESANFGPISGALPPHTNC
jgi:hypothetical protein